MWSTLLLPLLLLHFVQLHATLAMATASGGLTVIDGASTTTSSSSSSSSSTTTSSTTTTGSSSSSSSSISNNPSSTTSSSNLNNAVASSNQRKRHRKRNSSWYDYRNYSENNTAVEWVNPCAGDYYTPPANERRRSQQPKKKIFKQLKRAAGTEYRELNSTQEQKGIDINNMQMWSYHKINYKFLPKLKPNSTIALKRWYRNMQTYVASFAYLRRVQINWERQYLKRESAVAKELKKLLLSSRSMLCELETAVNLTYPAPLTMSPGKQRRQLQLPQISRNDMNRRLKLRSKAAAAAAATTTETVLGATGASTAIGEADSIDMSFVKHHYYEFLRTMYKLLRRDSKRERQQRRQRRQRRQQLQRQLQRQQQHLPLHHQHQLQQQQQQQQQKQRQQRQWQQRLQQTFVGSGNRKEFNEVSKPQLDAARGSVGRRGKLQQPHQAAATGAANHHRRQQQRRVLRT